MIDYCLFPTKMIGMNLFSNGPQGRASSPRGVTAYKLTLNFHKELSSFQRAYEYENSSQGVNETAGWAKEKAKRANICKFESIHHHHHVFSFR